MRHVALRSLALAALLAAFAASAAHGGTQAEHRAAALTGHCKVVGKGTAWRYKGQKGTAYTIEADRASACAVGRRWLVRLTDVSGVPKTPPGWQCITAVSVAGQCEKKGAGVFEWTAKLK
jgi:hypothetical protein